LPRAREAFELFTKDPNHAGLRLKRVHSADPIYSVRVSLDYRALARRTDDAWIWFWIGSHSDPLVPMPGHAQERLWVGVLRADGVAIPVAVHTNGSWTTPWPDVWYSRPPAVSDSEPPEPIGGPSGWTVYADSDRCPAATPTVQVCVHVEIPRSRG
jgi:hypothetical protein